MTNNTNTSFPQALGLSHISDTAKCQRCDSCGKEFYNFPACVKCRIFKPEKLIY